MTVRANKSLMLLLTCVPGWTMAADAVMRSGFETSTCSFSFELEPNDAPASATAVYVDPATKSAVICGENAPPFGSDVDYFEFPIASTSTLVAETIKGDGAACASNSPQSLTVYDSSLAVIATDSGGGTDGCASLDGTISASLQNLPPGNYYLKVAIPVVAAETTSLPYALSIKLL